MGIKKDIPITREKVISASWALLRENGIENFTMRRLAEKLDIKAATIYWHFKNKQHIFQELANEVAEQVLLKPEGDGDWKDQLHSFSMNFRDQLRTFACSAQLMTQTLPSTPEYIRLINKMLLIIEPLTLNDQDKFSSVICLINYVLSFELDQYERDRVNLEIQKEGGPNAQERFLNALDNLPKESAAPLYRIYHNNINLNLVGKPGSDIMFRTGLTILILGIEKLSQVDIFSRSLLFSENS